MIAPNYDGEYLPEADSPISIFDLPTPTPIVSVAQQPLGTLPAPVPTVSVLDSPIIIDMVGKSSEFIASDLQEYMQPVNSPAGSQETVYLEGASPVTGVVKPTVVQGGNLVGQVLATQNNPSYDFNNVDSPLPVVTPLINGSISDESEGAYNPSGVNVIGSMYGVPQSDKPVPVPTNTGGYNLATPSIFFTNPKYTSGKIPISPRCISGYYWNGSRCVKIGDAPPTKPEIVYALDSNANVSPINSGLPQPISGAYAGTKIPAGTQVATSQSEQTIEKSDKTTLPLIIALALAAKFLLF